MANDTTLNPNSSVTDENSASDQGNIQGSEQRGKEAELSNKDNDSENSNSSSDLDAKSKGEFINALGEKNKKLEEKDQKLSELQKQLEEFKKKEREKRIAEMSDAERLEYENAELRKKLYEKDILSFSKEQLSKHGLADNPMAEIVMKNPWLVPEVQEHLGEKPSWEEVQEAVEQYLPSYLESLKKPNGADSSTTQPKTDKQESSDDSKSGPTDPERPSQESKKRIWRASEIQKMNIAEYQKNRAEIMQAYTEGRVVA